MKLRVTAPVHGRIHKADIAVLDDAGKVRLTDRANLSEIRERRRVARDLAGKLDCDAQQVEADLEAEWVRAVNERSEQQAAQATAQGAPESSGVEILDDFAGTVRRPLCLVNGRAYAAAWLPVQITRRQSVDPKTGTIVAHDPPLVETVAALAVVRDDGVLFADAALSLPGARPLTELGLAVCLPTQPPPSRVWSGAGVKRYVAGERGWVTRHIGAFCPRQFSATRLPDDILGSRAIITPLVRSGDERRAKHSPADYEAWPCDRRRLVDDLWALGLTHRPALREYDARAAKRARLAGRNLEPWRAILAVALWLEEWCGVAGLFGRLEQLSQDYQGERMDLGSNDAAVVAIKALRQMVGDTPERRGLRLRDLEPCRADEPGRRRGGVGRRRQGLHEQPQGRLAVKAVALPEGDPRPEQPPLADQAGRPGGDGQVLRHGRVTDAGTSAGRGGPGAVLRRRRSAFIYVFGIFREVFGCLNTPLLAPSQGSDTPKGHVRHTQTSP